MTTPDSADAVVASANAGPLQGKLAFVYSCSSLKRYKWVPWMSANAVGDVRVTGPCRVAQQPEWQSMCRKYVLMHAHTHKTLTKLKQSCATMMYVSTVETGERSPYGRLLCCLVQCSAQCVMHVNSVLLGGAIMLA